MNSRPITLSRILITLGLIIVLIPAIIALGTYSSIKGYLEEEMDNTNRGFATLLSKQAILYLQGPKNDLERTVEALNKNECHEAGHY